jgi:hypothetical protein
MPTVLTFQEYRFYFYSRENNVPPHIHVEWGDKLAKYWLEPWRWNHTGGSALTS